MGHAEPKLPALQEVGGSFCRSLSSLRIRFDAICLPAYFSSLFYLPCARAKQSNEEAPTPVHTTPTQNPQPNPIEKQEG